MDEELDSNAKDVAPEQAEAVPDQTELKLQHEHEMPEEQPHATTEENSDISFSHSNLEASSEPPLQLLNNEADISTEMPEQILDESAGKLVEDVGDLSLTVNIEEQLKEFDGTDDEAMSNKEGNEPIDNLVDALCDSESSKHGAEAVENVDVHSDGEDELSRNANDDKDIFEEVDMSLVEKERTTTSEENDVLADDRTQHTGDQGKCDQTEDEESRTGSRMEVDHDDQEDDGHVEHIVDDHSHEYNNQSELEGVEDNHRNPEEGRDDSRQQDAEDDSTKQGDTEGDVQMTSITERITSNNEDEEESNENDERKASSKRNTRNAHTKKDQSNCVESEIVKDPIPRDELQDDIPTINLTDEPKETPSRRGRPSSKLINMDDAQEKNEMDKMNDSTLSVTSARTTRGRDAHSKIVSGKTVTESDANLSQDENKSRTRTRLLRKESPETVMENSKDKNASLDLKSRKKIRELDGTSGRATPDTVNRSKAVEEVEEIETPEHSENIELKELQIKELVEDLPEEKCTRCRKNRPCLYKYMKNGEVRFLCCLKCVNGFRTSSKDTFHLVARKIAIGLVFDVQQTCEACKHRKICRYRLKRPENESQFIFLCGPKCYDSFVGTNVEKFFKRRKVYLVHEVLTDASDVDKKCIKCFHVKKCLYYFRDDENVTHYICDDTCFNEIEKEEGNRLKLKRRSVRVRDLGLPPDIPSHAVIQQTPQPPPTNEPRSLTRTDEEAEQARFDREASLVRRCGECLLIIPSSRNILEWETLPFCNDTCLEKYQHVIGSNCTNCNSLVSSTSMGKYCVRFGFEVRQFCSSHCLDTYKKKNLKECAHCQKDISHDKDGFLAPVGDKSQFKDFCSKECVKKYEDLLNPRKKQNTGTCAVCNLDKLVRVDLFLDDRSFEFCSNPCFSAFKFVNNISPDQCALCLKYFERKSTNAFTLYEDNMPKMFCSRICLTVFISVNRKIVSCQWCKVKKYNFDMILRNNAGLTTTLCSITCLRKYLGPGSINAGSSALVVRLQKICDQCHNNCNPTFSLAMSDSTSRNFCTQQCVIDFQAIHKRPVNEALKGAGQKRQSPYPIGLPKKLQPKADKSIIRPVQLGQQSPPQSPAISALTVPPTTTPPQTQQTTPAHSAPSPPPATPSPAPPSVEAPSPDFSLPLMKKRGRPKKNIDITVYDTDTSVATAPSPPAVRPVKKRSIGTNTTDMGGIKSQIITVPPPQPQMVNKMIMCTPSAEALAMQARRPTCTVELQTEDSLEKKYCVPIPVPIYVPQPMHMYSMPFPVPIPIPLPIPVPIFIPTTRNTAAGIMKEIKKIQDKMPADPFEAELLMMAEMVADEKRNESDSEPEETAEDTAVVEYAPEGDDIFQMDLNISTGYEEQPNVDIETSMPANAIQQVTPSLEGVNDYMTQQQQMMMMEPQRRLISNVNTPRKRTVSPPAARGRLSTTPPQKRHRPVQQPQQPQQQQMLTSPVAEPIRQTTEPAERPDANMCLKYTFGVNAWRQWVMNKNADIEKSTIRRKTFKTELLQLTADELNYSLCLFVKEVRKPNGSEYAPDTIYYLVLGIQQYLYENGRIDNIFTDPYYERFTDCLDEVARKFSILYNDSQYIVTRVEEEHLWECKQLGAHSPHVLLSTLMFFNTKHFNLTTVDEHMQLSFSHIMKHWKRNPAGKQNQSTRNVLLRFYPPQTTPDNPRKKKVYEQQENENNPLRCPVKLYEFYLSKCPESVKTRSDVFYLQPERSCVPDSPVWYSTQPLSREALNKMLHRVKMVKEINVALLSSQ